MSETTQENETKQEQEIKEIYARLIELATLGAESALFIKELNLDTKALVKMVVELQEVIITLVARVESLEENS